MRKIISTVFIVLMVFIFVMSCFAANDSAQHLNALDIMKGDTNGDLMLDKEVSRYQAALFFVQTLTGNTNVGTWNSEKTSSIFSDVKEYGTAIDYAYGIKIVLGRGNGEFGPNDSISYQDMLVMAVRALGYETDDMIYPMGYIIAAEKLGLTEDVDDIAFTDKLDRANTATIIWNMLNTQVAITDPFTKELVYPNGELSYTTKPVKRETLMEKSGYVDGVIEGIVSNYVENDDNVTTVEINGIEFDIVDLGFDELNKVDYLGLNVKVYVNCAVDEFAAKYESDKADVVFVAIDQYEEAMNLGDKTVYTDEKGLVINGTKYNFDKYDISVKTFGDYGWKDSKAADFYALTDEDANGFFKIGYAIDTDEKTIDILFTPYAFGFYDVKTIKYSGDNEDHGFVCIDDVILGSKIKVTDNTKVVSRANGETNIDIKVVGYAKNNDFIVYDYNEYDNILRIVMNCGGRHNGRLTGLTKDSVKINGTLYPIGLEGTPYDNLYNGETFMKYMESDNPYVDFVLLNGSIIFIEQTDETNSSNYYDFAIITLDKNILIDLLDISAEKFDKTVNHGYYIQDGAVTVGMLDLASGKWELANIIGIATDYEDDEFDTVYNIAEEINWFTMLTNYTYADRIDFIDAVTSKHLVAVVSVDKNGNYVIADKQYVDCGHNDSLIFTEGVNKTNAIVSSSDEDVEPARIIYNDKFVYVVIDGTNTVYVSIGKQPASNSIAAPVDIYAGTSANIVATTDIVIAEWDEGDNVISDNEYYLYTSDSSTEYETDTITYYNVYSFVDNKFVNITMDREDSVKYKNYAPNTILCRNTKGVISATTNMLAVAQSIDEEYEDFAVISFADEDTVNDTVYNAITVNVLTLGDIPTGIVYTNLDYNSNYPDYAESDEKTFVYGKIKAGDAQINAPTAEIFDDFTMIATNLYTLDENDVKENYIVNLHTFGYVDDDKNLNLLVFKIITEN